MCGAQERTRTSTTLRPLAPEASASASSATWAQPAENRSFFILTRDSWIVNAPCSPTRPSAPVPPASRRLFDFRGRAAADHIRTPWLPEMIELDGNLEREYSVRNFKRAEEAEWRQSPPEWRGVARAAS
jgi:hypothetical protein